MGGACTPRKRSEVREIHGVSNLFHVYFSFHCSFLSYGQFVLSFVFERGAPESFSTHNFILDREQYAWHLDCVVLSLHTGCTMVTWAIFFFHTNTTRCITLSPTVASCFFFCSCFVLFLLFLLCLFCCPSEVVCGRVRVKTQSSQHFYGIWKYQWVVFNSNQCLLLEGWACREGIPLFSRCVRGV